jgi:hypothetical protein
LESRNYVSKQLLKIERGDGSIITSQNDILQETKIFYENLYRRRENVESKNFHERLKKFDNIPKLSKDESDSLEGHIMNAEVLNFLKHMKNEKSPGPDGFTCEFFNFLGKRYWHIYH